MWALFKVVSPSKTGQGTWKLRRSWHAWNGVLILCVDKNWINSGILWLGRYMKNKDLLSAMETHLRRTWVVSHLPSPWSSGFSLPSDNHGLASWVTVSRHFHIFHFIWYWKEKVCNLYLVETILHWKTQLRISLRRWQETINQLSSVCSPLPQASGKMTCVCTSSPCPGISSPHGRAGKKWEDILLQKELHP